MSPLRDGNLRKCFEALCIVAEHKDWTVGLTVCDDPAEIDVNGNPVRFDLRSITLCRPGTRKPSITVRVDGDIERAAESARSKLTEKVG